MDRWRIAHHCESADDDGPQGDDESPEITHHRPWLRINRKNVSTYHYRNCANFIMFSNYEDAAGIEEDDRRYSVWIGQAKKREGGYYTALYHWFDNEGAEALLYFL